MLTSENLVKWTSFTFGAILCLQFQGLLLNTLIPVLLFEYARVKLFFSQFLPLQEASRLAGNKTNLTPTAL